MIKWAKSIKGFTLEQERGNLIEQNDDQSDHPCTQGGGANGAKCYNATNICMQFGMYMQFEMYWKLSNFVLSFKFIIIKLSNVYIIVVSIVLITFYVCMEYA